MVPVGTGSGRTHIMPAEYHPTPTAGRSIARRRRTGFSGRQFRPIRGRPTSGNRMVRPCSWALPASRLAGGAKRKEHAMSEKHNSVIAVIGIDIGKNSFHVVGLDGRGAIALRQKWSRGQVETRLANMPA